MGPKAQKDLLAERLNKKTNVAVPQNGPGSESSPLIPVVVVAALAGGAFYVVKKRKKATTNTEKNQKQRYRNKYSKCYHFLPPVIKTLIRVLSNPRQR